MIHDGEPRACEWPALLRSVREATQHAESLEDALRAALERICVFTGWQAGRAEIAGLVVPLGRWVLEEACQKLQRLPERLSLSVNLSGRQLLQPDLVEQVEQVLKRTSFNPQRLRLELTESILVGSGATAVESLERPRALSLGLCIDDFGTGQSHHLRRGPRRLPVSARARSILGFALLGVALIGLIGALEPAARPWLSKMGMKCPVMKNVSLSPSRACVKVRSRRCEARSLRRLARRSAWTSTSAPNRMHASGRRTRS